jgi:hypothetical protein
MGFEWLSFNGKVDQANCRFGKSLLSASGLMLGFELE